MKRLLIALSACLVAAGPTLLPTRTAYAETKPLAVVAIKSYDDLLGSINYVGELSERPDLGSAFEGLLALGTQGMGLSGIDKTRPWGVVVQANGDDITGYVFLPITESKSLVKLLGLYTTVKPQGGLQKFTQKNGDKAFYGKTAGKWMMFSDKPSSLKSVAADPTTLLAGAGKGHLITGRVFLANVPENYRQIAIDRIRDGARKELDKKSDEPEDLHTARAKASDDIVEAAKIFINNMDQINLGWGIDRSAEKLYAETSLTALADTQLAEQMASLEKTTSKFTALDLPGQAFSAHIAAPITDLKAELLNAIIALARKQALADAEKKADDNLELAKGLINNVADLLEKNVKGGRFDMAASVALEPEAAVALAAGYVADGDLLDKTLHTLAGALKDKLPPVADMIKLDTDKVGDVKLHTITIPVGQDWKDREKAVRIFGEELHIVVGVGTDSAYFAAGRDAMEKLKKAISANATVGDKSVSPVAISISAEKLAAFQAVNGEKKDLEKAKMAAEELKTMPGKDHITLVAKSIPRGVHYRLEIEKGVLRAAVKMGADGKN